MSMLRKRETKPGGHVEPVEPVDLTDPFDRLHQALAGFTPHQRLWLGRTWLPDELIRVDEFREKGSLVVRADLPGIDPSKDVEVTVSDGMLHIRAKRREESGDEQGTGEKGYVRRELRYGSLYRSLPLPPGVSDTDVAASYKDGILEIRVRPPEPQSGAKIPVSTS